MANILSEYKRKSLIKTFFESQFNEVSRASEAAVTDQSVQKASLGQLVSGPKFSAISDSEESGSESLDSDCVVDYVDSLGGTWQPLV